MHQVASAETIFLLFAIELRERYDGVRPAYHMNKKHWSDLYLNELEESFIKVQIRASYQLVVSRLPKKWFIIYLLFNKLSTNYLAFPIKTVQIVRGNTLVIHSAKHKKAGNIVARFLSRHAVLTLNGFYSIKDLLSHFAKVSNPLCQRRTDGSLSQCCRKNQVMRTR